MNEITAQKLLNINREFYQTFASQFSDTRMRIQPGVNKILKEHPVKINILDLGCGNGNTAKALIKLGFTGVYIGMDISPNLLDIAITSLRNFPNFKFIQGNLASKDWKLMIKEQQESYLPGSKFDLVLAFATLHHIPSKKLRVNILRIIHGFISNKGKLCLSNWQFLNSERLKNRLQPWEVIGLAEDDVESGDYLLDWRQGGIGLRYIHHFSEEELKSLADKTGFNISETFFSDGEGGKLGLYQTWEKIKKN